LSELAELVSQFHALIGQRDPETPRDLTPHERILRARLIAEEAVETVYALVGEGTGWDLINEMDDRVSDKRRNKSEDSFGLSPRGALDEIADGCIDTMVVCAGTLLTAGIYDEPLIDLVMRANMAKKGGGKDASGKAMKPPGWRPPDIRAELIRQGWKP
jgi:predicted HAD superfamily Cof-like phosphohydrolase